MTGLGTVLSNDAGLSVAMPDVGWSFLLRRVDLTADNHFRRYHQKPIAAEQVEAFVPNWRKLAWIRVPDGLLNFSESRAPDGDYCVTICARLGSGMKHDNVIAAFLGFMDTTYRP